MNKQMISLVLALSLAFAFVNPAIATNSEPSQEPEAMDKLDVYLTANTYLRSDEPSDFSADTSDPEDYIPLFNPDGDIVAYYVSFAPSGYAVINNNRNNPAPICKSLTAGTIQPADSTCREVVLAL